MKTAINTRTQEEYDALFVKCIEKPGEEFICRNVTVGKDYPVVGGDESDYLLIDDLGERYYFQKRFFLDYKALYLEGRELLEEALNGLRWYQDAYRDEMKECDYEFAKKATAYLTKHKDLTEQ